MKDPHFIPENRFPKDRILRSNGFQIHTRSTKRNTTLWIKQHKLYSTDEALKLCVIHNQHESKCE